MAVASSVWARKSARSLMPRSTSPLAHAARASMARGSSSTAARPGRARQRRTRKARQVRICGSVLDDVVDVGVERAGLGAARVLDGDAGLAAARRYGGRVVGTLVHTPVVGHVLPVRPQTSEGDVHRER